MSYPKIIGFAGAAGVGKTTTANALVGLFDAFYGLSHHIMSFASPVKTIAMMLGWDGKKDARGRKLLQSLGTDTARAYDPDVWVKRWERDAKEMADIVDIILVDDVRFPNEVQAIQRLGGTVIRLLSETRGLAKDFHASERTDFPVDFEIWADVPPEQVAQSVISKIITPASKEVRTR